MPKQRRRDVVRTLGLAATGLSAFAGCNRPTNDGTETTPETDTTATPTPTETATPTPTETATPAPTETVTDMAGRAVAVPETVRRVVAFGPGALRAVIYLGAIGRVVGVESLETGDGERPSWPYAVANRGLADRPTVGSRERPDVERILAQDAQVVFLANASAEAADRLQSELEIPVVVVRPGGVVEPHRSEFFSTLRIAGRVLNQSTRATRLVRFVDETVADLRERTPSGDPPRTYVGYVGRDGPAFTRTRPDYPPFAFVGADNVAGGVDAAGTSQAVTVDPARIVEWNPTHVFVERGADSYDAVRDERYRSVDAVERRNVFGVLPIHDYGVNVATALANAYFVGNVLFPLAYRDVDPEAKANDLYEEFVRGRIYDEVTDAYGGGFGHVDVW